MEKMEILASEVIAEWKSVLDNVKIPCEDLSYDENLKRQCEYNNNKQGDFNFNTSEYKDEHNCDKCKNKGVIYSVKDNDIVVTNCECKKTREILRNAHYSGLSHILKQYTFKNYNQSEAWQERIYSGAKKFVDGNYPLFYIGGQSGTGKTHICTAVCGDLLKKHYDVQYMQWRSEITKLKSIIQDVEEYQKVMERLKTVDVLYIDDLFKMGRDINGEIRPTTADINILFTLINDRLMNKNLKTIISTEMTISDLIEIDEAIAGRIIEHSKNDGLCISIKKDIAKNQRLKGVVEV